VVLANALKCRLSRGQPILGIWSIIPSPIVAEIIGQAGMDFQILDAEHGVFDFQALDNSIRACESAGCAPLVRAPGPDQFFIQTVLDIGAHGIIVPQVSSYQAAQTAVKLVRYGPDGVRGFNPFTRAGNYGLPSAEKASQQFDAFVLSSIIIENTHAFRDLDRILTIPGLDMLYLGVYDMSVSLGCRGQTNDPRIEEFVEVSIRKIRESGKAAGVMVKTRQELDRAIRLGANVLVFAVDTLVIHNAISEAVAMSRMAWDFVSRERC